MLISLTLKESKFPTTLWMGGKAKRLTQDINTQEGLRGKEQMEAKEEAMFKWHLLGQMIHQCKIKYNYICSFYQNN